MKMTEAQLKRTSDRTRQSPEENMERVEKSRKKLLDAGGSRMTFSLRPFHTQVLEHMVSKTGKSRTKCMEELLELYEKHNPLPLDKKEELKGLWPR